MKFEILLSTQNSNIDVLDRENIFSNVVVVNQCSEYRSNIFRRHSYNVHWIDSRSKGLSTSRNLAIKNSTADICLFADDDLFYNENVTAIITDEFIKYESADIIIFTADGYNTEKKHYWPTPRRLSYMSSMKVSSWQISFRRNVIVKNGLFLKEEFGSGAKYYCGEENIWLWDCLNKGLKIFYVPVKIATHIESESSWFKGYTEWFFISKGAAFTAMSTALSIFLIMQFAIRKHYLWKGDVSFKKSLSWMLNGRSMYLLDQRSILSKK